MSSSPERYRVMRLIARLNIGGPAIHTTLLTERLDPARYESLLVAGMEAENEGNMLELMGNLSVQPLVIPSLGREISPLNDLRTLQQVTRLMRRWRPHIVHTHTAKAGFVGRMAARPAGVPIVVHTFHGNVFRGYFSPAKTRLFVKIERFLARGTDRIVVLSEQQKHELLSLGIGRGEQYRIIPLGLDLQPFMAAERCRGQLRGELGIATDVPLVGIVARLVPIKAIDLFLDAAKQVLHQVPTARFLVVGDGELRADLGRHAAGLGLGEAVLFTGFRGDLPRVNADLDCVVLCSKNEGLPVAIIEALAAARPVVATDVGGVKDLIVPNVTGYLVPSGDVDSLARAINLVLTQPDAARQWGLAGRERVYPALDIDRLVRDIDDLYSEMLSIKNLISKSVQ